MSVECLKISIFCIKVCEKRSQSHLKRSQGFIQIESLPAMTELRRLCTQLSDGLLDAAQLHRLLRWFGFRGFTTGVRPHLSYLIDLEPSFRRLAQLYPNLKPACEAMCMARSLQERLTSIADQQPAIDASEWFEQDRRAWSQSPEGFPLPLAVPQAVSAVPMAMLMYAASYLLVRIWDGHAKAQPIYYRVIWKFGAGEQMDKLWGSDGEPHVAMDKQTIGGAIEYIWSRSETLAAQGATQSDSWRPWPDNKREFQAFDDLLNQTDLTDLFHPVLAPQVHTQPNHALKQELNQGALLLDEPTEDQHARIKIRDSHQLDDRELLPEWTYGLTQSERDILVSYMGPAQPVGCTDIVRHEETVSCMAGCLAQVAMVTANTIGDAAKLHCVVRAKEEPQTPDQDWQDRALTLVCDPHGEVIKTTWQPYAPNSERGLGPILTLQPLNLGITRLHRNCTLDELSPIPVDEILDDIRKDLAKRVNRGPTQVDRGIKHTLAQEIFAATANRAIIKHICAHRPQDSDDEPDAGEPRTGESVGTESLSSYVHPDCKAVHQAYQRAARKILTLSALAPNPKEDERDITAGSQWIATQDLIRIVQWLAQQATSQVATDPFQLHEHYVIYVAAMLVAATGHRRAKALFPFLFTLDLEDMLAFIADKILAGSEARFVPLIELVVQQLREYEAHVLWFIDQVQRTDPQLADNIRACVGLKRFSKTDEPKLQTGLLFRIRRGRPVPISTAAVDLALKRAANELGLSQSHQVSTRLLRRNLATYLSDEGSSGMAVEMLLGHNGDQHVFGAASSWIPQDQFEAMRPSVDRYMQQHGWQVVRAPWAKAYRGRFKPELPSFKLSDHAYEGRSIAATQARIRARQAILDALPIEFLGEDQTIDFDDEDANKVRTRIREQNHSDAKSLETTLEVFDAYLAQWQNDQRYVAPRAELLLPRHLKNHQRAHSQEKTDEATGGADGQAALEAIQRAAIATLPQSKLRGGRAIALDEAMIAKIRTQIEQDLEGDPQASAKVLSEFAALARGWRRSGKYRVSAASINLARFAPGPIDISFPRHLALAKAVVKELPQTIEAALTAKHVDTKTRLGAIMVLMVVGEAVLKLEELKQVMLELQGQSLVRYEGQLHVRAGLSSGTVIYDRTVDLNFKTAAAVLGYLKFRQSDEVIPFEHIEEAANKILKSTIRPMGTMDLTRLQQVMRPYWFLRFPASVYATVVGDQECNAPSDSSLKLLLGATPPALVVPPPNPRVAKPAKEVEIKRALTITRTFLTRARGTFEKSEGASRSQRKRLRDELNGLADTELFELCTRHQIVELWVGFLFYLLEVGGLRVDTYSFNTLTTFQSNILEKLYTIAWGLDLLEMDAQELRHFYERVIQEVGPQQRKAAKTPFERFLGYLHQWWGTPHFGANLKTAPRQRVTRSVIVPTRLIDRAVDLAARPDGKNSTVGTVGAALIATNHAFGLRTKEGFGIKHGDLGTKKSDVVRLRRNSIRSLKTCERTIPVSLADTMRLKVVQARKAASSDHRAGSKASLFGLPGQPQQLYDYAQVTSCALWAIKTATGDPEATVYALRHTYANSILSQMLMPSPEASAVSIEVAKSLGLPSSALKQLEHCRPDARSYPFQIDRLALWMGQSGTRTLSTTYWHGAWLVASEYCGRQALKVPWTSGVMGALLGVESSGFRKKLPPHTVKETATEGQRCAIAVEAYVKTSKVALLVDKPSLETAPSIDLETTSNLPVQKMLDGLLMLRRHQGGDFGELACNAEVALHVSGGDAARFYGAYSDVGSVTGFLDFEPDGLREGEFKAMRVDGGQARRKRLIDIVYEGMNSSVELTTPTLSVVRDWANAVNGNQPLLVSRGLDELKRHFDWLKSLGYEQSNIRVHCFKADEQQWQEIQKMGLQAKKASHRLSRSLKIGFHAEFGLEVVQSKFLPNKREFQRVMLALTCAHNAGLLQMEDVT